MALKRTLVTGGTGFVGANLVRRLLREGHEVHLLVQSGFRSWRIEEVLQDVQLHVVDLGVRESLDPVLSTLRPDWIFHLATYGAYPSQTNLPQMLRTNVIGTVNLVEALLPWGFEAFINTGSSSEYGYRDTAPSERECPEPNSHYAVTKASATLFCQFTARTRAMHLTTLRLYSVFGPFEEPTRLIPTLIIRGQRGELPPLVDPDVARDYVYVDDVVDAYLLAAQHQKSKPGTIYNVGTGVQTPLRDVVDVATCAFDISAKPHWGSMPNRSWDTTTWIANSELLRSELGWQPGFTLETGFRATVAWFQRERAAQRLSHWR